MAWYLDGKTSLSLIRTRRVALQDASIPITYRKVHGLHSEHRLHSEPEFMPGTIEDATVPSDEQVRALLTRELKGLTPPVGFLVEQAKDRRSSVLRRSYTCKSTLPQDSFVALAPNLFACTPEFALVQSAAHMTDVEIAQTAYELCGVFSIDQRHSDADVRTVPFASVASMQAFCSKASYVHGAPRVRRMLEYVLDGAASPREVDLALLLFLSRRYGGYGLPKGVLNQPCSAVQRGRIVRLGDGKPYIPDIGWPGKGLAVEYDSAREHSDASRALRDVHRRNIFLSYGVKTFAMTSSQMKSVGASDDFARRIAKELGHETRKRDWTEEWKRRQEKLRSELGLETDRSEFDGWTRVDNPSVLP